ncbi:MAG: class I SAM-dependent methyltransferase, partial [Roseibacillus sp.]
MRLTELAQIRVGRAVRPGETVIDATVGNGHDTVFLANCVGEGGRVIGLDIQERALELARCRLLENGIAPERVSLFSRGHEFMGECVTGPVGAVMFNLGYLPGGDHSITTQTAGTVSALEQAWKLLRPGGLISMLCYRGHPGALDETNAVRRWLETFPKSSPDGPPDRKASITGPSRLRDE